MNKYIVAFLLLTTFSTQTLAVWDGEQTNKSIEFIQMDSTYIYISLKGIPNMCTGGNVWGVLNQNDVSHKNMLSVLLTAKATGGLVDVYSNVCTSPSGYCCIGNILLH